MYYTIITPEISPRGNLGSIYRGKIFPLIRIQTEEGFVDREVIKKRG